MSSAEYDARAANRTDNYFAIPDLNFVSIVQPIVSGLIFDSAKVADYASGVIPLSFDSGGFLDVHFSGWVGLKAMANFSVVVIFCVTQQIFHVPYPSLSIGLVNN